MPHLRSRNTGQLHEVPAAIAHDLVQSRAIMGNDWYNTQIANYPLVEPRITALHRGIDEYVQSLRNKKAPEPKKEEVAVEPLTIPIIPELGEDGVKRLYKTRYNQLESKYVILHSQKVSAQRRLEELEKEHERLHSQKSKLAREVESLKALTVDGAQLDKRIDQLCSVAQIQLPNVQFEMVTLEQKLDRFFGALLCRIRVEEIQDELAD